MKKFSIVLLLVFFAGCSAFDKFKTKPSKRYDGPVIKKVSDLRPGQNLKDINRSLGNPNSSQYIKGKLVHGYDFSNGFLEPDTPYLLIFDSKTQKLESWVIDEKVQAQRNIAAERSWSRPPVDYNAPKQQERDDRPRVIQEYKQPVSTECTHYGNRTTCTSQ